MSTRDAFEALLKRVSDLSDLLHEAIKRIDNLEKTEEADAQRDASEDEDTRGRLAKLSERVDDMSNTLLLTLTIGALLGAVLISIGSRALGF